MHAAIPREMGKLSAYQSINKGKHNAKYFYMCVFVHLAILFCFHLSKQYWELFFIVYIF